MRILFSVLLMFALCAKTWAEQNSTSIAVPPSVTANNPSAAVEDKQSVAFESLAQMNELVGLGMPALALSLLDEEQKKRQRFTADWYAFEYKRILYLSALERWQQLIERAQWLFDTAIPGRHITAKLRLWFETQQVMARLQLKQSHLAIEQLQTLLWNSNAENRDQSLPSLWRRLVIRAYLQMQRDDDARRALVKYERDYKIDATDIDWVLLQAQVLLRTNRPQQAIQILKQISIENAVDVEALLLIAQLQSEPKSAQQIYQQMREQLDGQVLSSSARWAKSYVAYLAAKILADQSAQISNLESMLSLTIEYPVFEDGYQVSADDLWDLYNKQGLIIANDRALLFGNDEQWLQLSNELIKNNPEKALQLNVALVLHTENFLTRQLQHKTIVEIIEKRKNGLELINQLYLHSKKVTDVNVLPDEVRYRLVDYALSESDYYEAATIMKSLKEPPEGKTLFDWRMRKARVLILQGEYGQSESLIRKTFSEKPKITRDELDRYIQVVFDFQTVQQHQQAIKLFDLLYIDGLDEKLKREIYFWKAESYFSLERFDKAALFYLQSARAVKDSENDLWAQSARFKAGKALMLAKIYYDAEKVYKELLLITDSEARKALINQNLQKIRLLKSAVKSSE
ncbi:MAG: hypothetical protein KAT61_00280 [Gammaproteobacteria bacterium]|nr:hypothetical protein [Gammaproteobacteria bacterium]